MFSLGSTGNLSRFDTFRHFRSCCYGIHGQDFSQNVRRSRLNRVPIQIKHEIEFSFQITHMREVHISRARSHVHSDNELYDQSPEGELGQGAQRAPDRPLGRGPGRRPSGIRGYPCRRHGGGSPVFSRR